MVTQSVKGRAQDHKQFSEKFRFRIQIFSDLWSWFYFPPCFSLISVYLILDTVFEKISKISTESSIKDGYSEEDFYATESSKSHSVLKCLKSYYIQFQNILVRRELERY